MAGGADDGEVPKRLERRAGRENHVEHPDLAGGDDGEQDDADGADPGVGKHDKIQGQDGQLAKGERERVEKDGDELGFGVARKVEPAHGHVVDVGAHAVRCFCDVM